ncbi:MAG: hypothetical protein FWC42_11070 [Proteobacteria bacterium]|nr:hypothetical protein [Pseudomonadota bacterium]
MKKLTGFLMAVVSMAACAQTMPQNQKDSQRKLDPILRQMTAFDTWYAVNPGSDKSKWCQPAKQSDILPYVGNAIKGEMKNGSPSAIVNINGGQAHYMATEQACQKFQEKMLYCTLLGEAWNFSYTSRNNGLTPQQTYIQIKGVKEMQSFDDKQLKNIINSVYFDKKYSDFLVFDPNGVGAARLEAEISYYCLHPEEAEKNRMKPLK